MSLAINSLMPNNAAYTNQLYRSVDKNRDSAYSRQEVSAFAGEYEKSTGVELDVEGLFKAYDVDIDGSLSAKEYDKVMEDDALGMNRLMGSFEAEAAPAEKEAASGLNMDDLMASLSKSQQNTVIQANWRAETTGNLLNAVFGESSLFSGLTAGRSSYAVSQYNNQKLFSLAHQMGNMASYLSNFSMLI